MKKKELYEAPSVETYDLVPEGNLLQTPSQGTNRADKDYSDNDLGDLI